MKKTIDELIRASQEISPGAFFDAHFDEICGFEHVPKGAEVLRQAVDLIGIVERGLSCDSVSKPKILVYLPIRDSASVVTWRDEFISALGTAAEPPLLYIYNSPRCWGEQMLDELIEEYRCPVLVQAINLQMLFRCYRNRGDDCYQTGLYVFSR